MRRNRLLIVTLSLMAVALLTPGPVHADITPPPGHLELCTIDKQQGDIETCLESPTMGMGDPQVLIDKQGNPAGTRDAYVKKLAAEGYVYRCRTGTSASFWTEIWCKPDKLKASHRTATFFSLGRGTLIVLASAVVLVAAGAAIALSRRRNQE